MAGTYGSTKRKPIGKMVVMGILSIALYGMLLSRQGDVVDYFSRGGVYAFLPIALAFVFSFVHGTFTGNFWTVMGIEAAKKKKEVK